MLVLVSGFTRTTVGLTAIATGRPRAARPQTVTMSGLRGAAYGLTRKWTFVRWGFKLQVLANNKQFIHTTRCLNAAEVAGMHQATPIMQKLCGRGRWGQRTALLNASLAAAHYEPFGPRRCPFAADNVWRVRLPSYHDCASEFSEGICFAPKAIWFQFMCMPSMFLPHRAGTLLFLYTFHTQLYKVKLIWFSPVEFIF